MMKMSKSVIVQLYYLATQEIFDVEVPLHISVKQLIYGLNEAYHFNLVYDNCVISSENPIACLSSDKTLESFGIHTGSTIIVRQYSSENSYAKTI